MRRPVSVKPRAARLWSIYNRCGSPKSLIPFGGFASEWEDDLAHRKQYDKRILAAAKKFLQNVPPLAIPRSRDSY
jgi:hypothetical protein